MLRADKTSVKSFVVAPIKWDVDLECWQIMPAIVATSVRVHTGVMPLRMRPPKGGDPNRFNTYIDQVFDPLFEHQAGDDKEGGSSPVSVDTGTNDPAGGCTSEGESAGVAEYEVERVMNRKGPAGRRLYLIKWKGYSRKSNTWEPAKGLSCDELIGEYEDSLVRAAAHPAFLADLCQEGCELESAPTEPSSDTVVGALLKAHAASETEMLSDDYRAVAELMARHKLKGEPAEWAPGYRLEMDNVSSLRLEALSEAGGGPETKSGCEAADDSGAEAGRST